jgi:carbamoylphosphate synthase large subunit
VTRPYPKVVYQREGSYRYKIYEHLINKGVKLYQEVPMLRTVTNKIKTYELIKSCNVLTPTTETYNSKKLLEYINKGKHCFIKPTYGQLGEGAIKVYPDYTYKISDTKYNTTKDTLVESIESLIKDKWKLKLQSFLIQDLVDMPKYKDSVFDARVMVQKDKSGNIVYSAHMARIGAQNKITSNIHTGGTFDKLENILQSCYKDSKIVDSLINSVRKGSIDICKKLDSEVAHFGELGLDWLFTKDGNAVCIEINPRPGKYIFSKEPNTEKQLRDRVLEYLSYLIKK